MTRRMMLVIALAVALGVEAAAGAQAVGGAASDGSFRFEWEITASRKGPRLDAYIYNR